MLRYKFKGMVMYVFYGIQNEVDLFIEIWMIWENDAVNPLSALVTKLAGSLYLYYY